MIDKESNSWFLSNNQVWKKASSDWKIILEPLNLTIGFRRLFSEKNYSLLHVSGLIVYYIVDLNIKSW